MLKIVKLFVMSSLIENVNVKRLKTDFIIIGAGTLGYFNKPIMGF